MKTLTLLRHAKSSWGDPGQRDFDRPLNARGRKAARAMGHEMRRLGLGFDRVVASPSKRTIETVEHVAETYGPLVPEPDERVYLASVPALLRIVRETGDAHGRLLIVGHNPGTEQLALLLAEESGLRAEAALKYPTGALAEMVFAVGSWGEVDAGLGALIRFIRPRDLDPALGPEGGDDD